MKFANAKGGLTSAQKYLALFAVSLVPFSAACKLNKDANCDNPKASCFKKDTAAPRVTSTNPPSSPSSSNPGTASGVANVIIYFSEPMKNAADKASYPDPTNTGAGGGSTKLRITSVTKFDDQTVQLNIAGTMANGPIDFDLGLLTDLAGNTLANPTMTIQGGALTIVPATAWVGSTVSGSGYTSVSLSWSNSTPYPVDWIIKKNGTSCSDASAVTNASSGNTLVTGLAAGATPGAVTVGLAEFPAAPVTPTVTTLRICMTNAAQGIDVQLSADITRDDTAPSINTISPPAGRCDLPYAMTITCSDNVDKIIYSYDSTGTGLVPTTPAFNMTTGAITAGTPYDTTNGFSLNTKGSVQFKYLCIDKAGHLNTGSVITTTCQSTVKWDTSLWSAPGPSQPYDVWK